VFQTTNRRKEDAGHGLHLRRRACSVLAVALIVVAALGGCHGNRGPERAIVSGSVRYQGQPVVNGLIRFLADPQSGMPTAGAFIVDGKYVADSQGGVPVGTHLVQIEAFRVAPATGPSDRSARPAAGAARGAQFLPEKYNVHTTLKATIPAGSGKITKDFDLSE
jgi:hypothetical protein